MFTAAVFLLVGAMVALAIWDAKTNPENGIRSRNPQPVYADPDDLQLLEFRLKRLEDDVAELKSRPLVFYSGNR